VFILLRAFCFSDSASARCEIYEGDGFAKIQLALLSY